jgi:hypothetical protein
LRIWELDDHDRHQWQIELAVEPQPLIARQHLELPATVRVRPHNQVLNNPELPDRPLQLLKQPLRKPVWVPVSLNQLLEGNLDCLEELYLAVLRRRGLGDVDRSLLTGWGGC